MVALTPVMCIQGSSVVEWTTVLDVLLVISDKCTHELLLYGSARHTE